MPLTKVKSLGTENIGGANRNLVINGAMMISQRATTASFSGSSGGYVSLDRFKTYANGGGALTLSQETDVPTGEGFKNSMKVTVNTNDGSIASGDYYVLQHRIEGNNSSHLMQGTANAQTITISFYVKSSLTGNLKIQQDLSVNNNIDVSGNLTIDNISYLRDASMSGNLTVLGSISGSSAAATNIDGGSF